jgi:hypothetical protein
MPDGLERALLEAGEALGQRATRRRTLERAAVALGALLGLPAARAIAARRRYPPGSNPLPGGYYGFCGHTYTTASCPAPYELPRIDARGLPLRPTDGRPIDNLGRLVDGHGKPVDEAGHRLHGPDGAPLPAAPRTRVCEDWVPEQHGVDAVLQGSWHRCCDGQVRKLWDCCTTSGRRINGDAALHGYCYGQRKVFCVTYHDTGVPC